MGMLSRPTKETYTMKRDLGALVLRATAGGLLAGHGAQKLFGSFGGAGLEGTAGWLESMGFRPGKEWAVMSGVSEFGGGMLTAFGLFHPVGPIGTVGAMSVAIRHVHWGKPIWASEGGAELPVMNVAIAIALAAAGPGRFSLDHLLGIRVPTGVVLAAAGAVALGIAASEQVTPPTPPETEAPATA